METSTHYEAIVIGTGFGGSVTASRLATEGVKVCILERGRRYEAGDFPRPVLSPIDGLPDPSRWAWLHDQGLFDARNLGQMHAVMAAGYGGGSLIYANVHLRTPAVIREGWPEQYRGDALSPYYDLVASMFEVKPIDEGRVRINGEHISAAVGLPKVARMHEVADALGRTQRIFHPPLALNFDSPHADPKLNQFGRLQQGCAFTGECDVGCQRQAKNTLDLNYLALAEDSGHATVRTLTEVIYLEAITLETGTPGYRIWARDHQRGGAIVHYEAETVFLGAGAIGSTELLLRSARLSFEEVGLSDAVDTPTARGLPSLENNEAIGRGYYGNADGMAVIYETERPYRGDFGPVITTTMLEGLPGDTTSPWFLLEDGGFPGDEATRIFVGSARSPFLLQKNRYTRSQRPQDADIADKVDAAFETALQLLSHMMAEATKRRETPAQRTDRRLAAHKAFLDRIGAAVGVGDKAISTLENAAGRDAVDHLLRVLAGLPDQETSAGHTLVPQHLRQIVLQITAGVETKLARLTEQIIQASIDRSGPLAVRMISRRLLKMTRLGVGTPKEEGWLWDSTNAVTGFIVKALVWAFNGLFPLSESEKGEMVALVRTAGNDRVLMGAPHDARLTLTDETLRRVVVAIYHMLIAMKAADDNTAVLLVMGPDQAGGTMELDTTGVTIHWPVRANRPIYNAQEDLMSKVATAMGGELRTSPVWALTGRPMTVHSQGGCAMGPEGVLKNTVHIPKLPDSSSSSSDAHEADPPTTTTGATTWYGEVHAAPGLFVVDAAGLPSAIGVNPASTICAVAEIKVEHVLRTRFGKQPPGPIQRRDTLTENPWATRDILREVADLVRDDTPPEISLKGVGVEFDEVLDGHWTEAARPWRLPRDHSALRWRTTTPPDTDGTQHTLRFEITATVPDLAVFLAKPHIKHAVAKGQLPRFHELEITGIAEEGLGVGLGITRYDVTGSMLLMVAPRQGHLLEVVEEMRYVLTLTPQGQMGPNRYVTGLKTLKNDTGMDIWLDTTRLRVDVYDAPPLTDDERSEHPERLEPEAIGRGIVRVHAEDFLRVQIGSMKAINTEDEAQKKWALARFGAFFFARLLGVYAPGVAPMLKQMGGSQ